MCNCFKLKATILGATFVARLNRPIKVASCLVYDAKNFCNRKGNRNVSYDKSPENRIVSISSNMSNTCFRRLATARLCTIHGATLSRD